MAPGWSRWWKRTLNDSESWASPPTAPPGSTPPPRWSRIQGGPGSRLPAGGGCASAVDGAGASGLAVLAGGGRLSLMATSSRRPTWPSRPRPRTAWASWRSRFTTRALRRLGREPAGGTLPAPRGWLGGEGGRLGEAGTDLTVELGGEVRVVAEVLGGLGAAVAERGPREGERGTGLGEQAEVGADLDQLGGRVDPPGVGQVELGPAVGGGELVLDHLDPGPRPDDLRAVLDGLNAADVQAQRGVELQGPAAGGELGVAEQRPDVLAQLVAEDQRGLGLGQGGGELPERLGDQPGLQPGVGVAHLALDLGPGDEAGGGVDRDGVDGGRAGEDVDQFQGLLAGVGLGEHEAVEVDAEPAGPGGVEGVLDVDDRGQPAGSVRLGDHAEGEGGLAGGLRAEDLGDPAPRDAADAERCVEGEAAGRDHRDGGGWLVTAQAAEGAGAVETFGALHRGRERHLAGWVVGCGGGHDRLLPRERVGAGTGDEPKPWVRPRPWA